MPARTALALTILAGLTATSLAGPGCRDTFPQPAVVEQVEEAQPRVDIVFVLDTTGSMGGLIDGAKQKIWAIANHIAMADSAPLVRIGLVAYRDRGDEYVTRLTPLTDDLDAVYTDLMSFVAAGGGDGPESVNQALAEAVNGFDWTDADNALRVIYLVGDAPPKMNFDDDIPYGTSASLAAERGLLVNTIQCGGWDETGKVWREIAAASNGRFFQIDQTGGTVAIATPYDDELATLNTELGLTVLAYGSDEDRSRADSRREQADALDAAAPAEALADRAAYNQTAAGRANIYGEQELLKDLYAGSVSLEDLDDDQLPEKMQAMTDDERAAYIEELQSTRDTLNTRIAELVTLRGSHLKAEAGTSTDSFDAKVLQSLDEQAADAGIDLDS